MPDCAVAVGLVWSMALTWKSRVLYMLAMMLVNCSGKPNLVSAVIRACGCILSKAFSKSRNSAYSEWLVLPAASSSLLTMRMVGCEVDLFCRNPYWVALSLWSMAASSLLWRSLANSLYAVKSSEIGLYISGSVRLALVDLHNCG